MSYRVDGIPGSVGRLAVDRKSFSLLQGYDEVTLILDFGPVLDFVATGKMGNMQESFHLMVFGLDLLFFFVCGCVGVCVVVFVFFLGGGDDGDKHEVRKKGWKKGNKNRSEDDFSVSDDHGWKTLTRIFECFIGQLST